MDIPQNLILVMGISGAVTVVNGVVSNFKYSGTTPPCIEPTKAVPSDQIRKKLPGFKTMHGKWKDYASEIPNVCMELDWNCNLSWNFVLADRRKVGLY